MHKAISNYRTGGGSLSQSKEGGKRKKVITRIKNPNGSQFLKVYIWTLVGFGFAFFKEKKKTTEEYSFPLFPPGFISVFRNLRVSINRCTNRNSTETVLFRNMGLEGAFGSPHPVLCCHKPDNLPSLNRISPWMFSSPWNYSFTTLILTSALLLSDFWFCFSFKGQRINIAMSREF